MAERVRLYPDEVLPTTEAVEIGGCRYTNAVVVEHARINVLDKRYVVAPELGAFTGRTGTLIFIPD